MSQPAPSAMNGVRQVRRCKHAIYNDHFQNYRRYGLPKAQLVIADIPYNVGKNAYGSNPNWSAVKGGLDRFTDAAAAAGSE